MGYFSNGTEGEMYVAQYCQHCRNYTDTGTGSLGCAIMDLHLLWNYDAVGKNANEDKLFALENFIPREKDSEGVLTVNGQCKMFLVKSDQDLYEMHGQERLKL